MEHQNPITKSDGETCPDLCLAFDIFGKRWNALIVDALAGHPRRFCDLRRALGSPSDRVLSERLKELTSLGLIVQSQSEYILTPLGAELTEPLETFRQWGGRVRAQNASKLTAQTSAVEDH